jgi:SAM-dependent methyltransferase
MKPNERENLIYAKGKKNMIDIEEKVLFSFLPESSGKKLLDIGCGTGEITLELKNKGFIVTGIDFSGVAVKKARKKGLDIILSNLDKDGIKFPDNSLDIVWAGDIIEHVFDPMFLLKEIARVLKPDGSFLFTVPNDFNFYNRLLIFFKGKSIQSGLYRRFKISKHHTFFSLELLEFMLNSSGFKYDFLSSVFFIPWSKYKRIVRNKKLGKLFGKLFIVKAFKK